MAFAALDPFAPVGAVLLAGTAGLDRLTVDAARRRGGLATRRQAHPLPQCLDDLGPSAVIPPGLEVVIHRSPRREVPRQHPPRATGTVEREDGIDHLAHIRLARPAVLSRARDQALQQ